MAYKFWNFKESNAEIEKLSARVAELEKQNAECVANAKAIEDAASTMQSDLAQAVTRAEKAEADLATAKASIASLTTEKDKAVAEAAEAKAKLANPSAIIKETASAQAAAIVAQVGHAPIAAAPGGTVLPETEMDKAKKLTGLAKVIAIEKAESAARNSKQ